MYNRIVNNVGAGSQFDGSEGAGLFEWSNDRSGVTVKRISLVMGGESKAWEIRVEDDDGIVSLLDKATDTTQNVDIVGDISISRGEKVTIITSSATSAMKAFVVWKDELQQDTFG